MVREETLRRQLLAAEDKLLAVLKQGGLEEFMVRWASLQETVQASAARGKLSRELLELNKRVCQDIADIVQSCLAVEDGINQAFNADDIRSDFILSNEGEDVVADPAILRSKVPDDDGVPSAIVNKSSPYSEPHLGDRSFKERSLPQVEDDSEDTSDFYLEKAAWLEDDLESEEEGFDEPDPDWEKMQEWLLANIAFPFLDPDQLDPIINTAPISPDHLETWVSEICHMCGWYDVYSRHAFNNRSRMHALCEAAFDHPPSEYSSGPIPIAKKVKSVFWIMRDKAIKACNYLVSARATLTVELERMADMLTSLPIGVGFPDGNMDEWSDVDWVTWEAEVVDQYNQLSLSASKPLPELQEKMIDCHQSVSTFDPHPQDEIPSEVKVSRPVNPPTPEASGGPFESGYGHLELKPFSSMPNTAIPTVTNGTKRKFAEFLAISEIADPKRFFTSPSLFGSVDLDDVFTDCHRSKRKRSHSPDNAKSHLSPSSQSADLLSPPSSASPGPSSPSSDTSSSGSESGSPNHPSLEDPTSPITFSRSPPPTSHYYLSPKPGTAKPDEGPCPSSSALDTPHTISANSTSTTSTLHRLPVPSNNLTACSSSVHSHYKYHGHGTAKATQYPKTNTNSILFDSNAPRPGMTASSQKSPASPEIYSQVQIRTPELNLCDATPSRPLEEQIFIQRKRIRADFKVDSDHPECESIGPSNLFSSTFHECHSSDSEARYKAHKPRKPGCKLDNARSPSGDDSLVNVKAETSRQKFIDTNTTRGALRVDLDVLDIRPTKRAHLASRDYSLSLDT